MPTPGTLRLNFVGRLPRRIRVDVVDTGVSGASHQRIASGPPATNPLVLQLPQTTGYVAVVEAGAYYDDDEVYVAARWPGLTHYAAGWLVPFNQETQGRFQAPPPATTGPRKGGVDPSTTHRRYGLDSLDGASDGAFGLDSLDGPTMSGGAFGAGALPAVIIGANGQVITRPAGMSDAAWAAVIDGEKAGGQAAPGQVAFNVGLEVLNATLTTIATIAALELQRTGQVSAQTALWQQQLAALQAGTGGGQYLTAAQIAQLQVLQSQAQQQQAALTPWYKEPAVMVPLAIVGGVIMAAGTAMMVRGRANRLPWGMVDGGWRAAAAWDY